MNTRVLVPCAALALLLGCTNATEPTGDGRATEVQIQADGDYHPFPRPDADAVFALARLEAYLEADVSGVSRADFATVLAFAKWSVWEEATGRSVSTGDLIGRND